MLLKYLADLKREFKGYNASVLLKDGMAGITVAAVALPLALAFGVSSGATAAAGLITAILAGIVISLLSGAPFQISGPTGAMTAILITIVSRYGMHGVFIASLLAGFILLICGVLKLGRLVTLIPMPVVTGFTSGIAIIIALGQMDNFFGTTSKGDTALGKIFSYHTLGFSPNIESVLIGLFVIAIMIFFPKKWSRRVPASLIGIIAAGLLSYFLKFNVAVVGDIPRTLLPDTRLTFSNIDFGALQNLIAPAFTIAALGMIESLLCGASASRMTDGDFDADRELVAQGVGNILLPFFGGVPATAAIARTSVAIKSGCKTRLTGVFHSVGLLLSMFLLGPVMAKLPLSALSGVLIVTAWRMNEWSTIKYFFKNKLKGAAGKFLITMTATVVFDLTIAIIIGVVFAIFLFVRQAAKLEAVVSKVDISRLGLEDEKQAEKLKNSGVVYLTGAIFFANVAALKEIFTDINEQAVTCSNGSVLECNRIIFSMRGVTTMDTSGAGAMFDLCEKLKDNSIEVMLCGLQRSVEETLLQAGVLDHIGKSAVYWSVDRALLSVK